MHVGVGGMWVCVERVGACGCMWVRAVVGRREAVKNKKTHMMMWREVET